MATAKLTSPFKLCPFLRLFMPVDLRLYSSTGVQPASIGVVLCSVVHYLTRK